MWLVCGKCSSKKGLFHIYQSDTYECQSCGRNSTYLELEEATERRIFEPVRKGKRIWIPSPSGGFWSND